MILPPSPHGARLLRTARRAPSSYGALNVALIAALAACSGAPPVAAPAPISAPAETAKPAAPPVHLGLIDEEPASDSPAAAVPAESLPALAGAFEPALLPPKLGPLLAVTGLGDQDVWMLAASGSMLRWDGSRVTDRGAPKCFTDTCCGSLVDCAKHPGLCARSATCQPFGPDCALAVRWGALEATPGGVIVSALIQTGGLRASLVESRLGRNGKWSCEQGTDDMVYPGSRGRGDGPHALELTLGGSSIKLEGPAYLVNHYGGHSLVIDGRAVALPEEARSAQYGVGLAARAPDDLWLWSEEGGQVWHGNGLGWSAKKTRLGAVREVWMGAPGSVWVLGALDADKDATAQLLRWDVDKGREERFATPGAQTVIQGSGPDFWLVGQGYGQDDGEIALDRGKKSFYRWDGRALLRAEAPLVFAQAWRSPAGDLWVVGADLAAKAPTAAALRWPAKGGQKP